MVTPAVPAPRAPLCWICRANPANSGEHKTKRSDLLAVFGRPTQAMPLYYHDLTRTNRPVGSLDTKILHAPIRICEHCNTTRTQPHDRAWERMSDALRGFDLNPDEWLRPARVFPYGTRSNMIGVHLYFLKLFGCMLEEAKANGHDLGIDIGPFSDAIMTGKPHPGVLLRFGKSDGTVGRSDLHAWRSDAGNVLATWLYQLGNIAVGVTYAPQDAWEPQLPHWHPDDRHYARRVKIADFDFAAQAKRASGHS